MTIKAIPCTYIDPSTNHRCAQPCIDNSVFCKLHTTSAHNNVLGRRWYEFLPQSLLQKYKKVLEDYKGYSFMDDIALIDARIADQLEEIDKADSWVRKQMIWDEIALRMELKAKLFKIEVEKRQLEHSTFTAEQVLLLLHSVSTVILDNVHDDRIVALIGKQIREISRTNPEFSDLLSQKQLVMSAS